MPLDLASLSEAQKLTLTYFAGRDREYSNRLGALHYDLLARLFA
jgi:hypothetical protein